MSKSIDEIAAGMREAVGDGHQIAGYIDFVCNLWGREVLISHSPPRANDGPIAGADLAANERAVFSTFVAAIPDYHQEDVEIVAQGETITLTETIVGTLPDGSLHHAPIQFRFTLRGGLITEVHGTFEAADTAPFAAVVAARGLRVPE
jgi:hypothetical protein